MTNGAEEYLSGNCLVNFPFADGQDTQGVFACFADALVYVIGADEPVIRNVTSDGITLRFELAVGQDVERLSVARSSVAFPIASGRRSWGSFVFVLSSMGIRSTGAIPETICPTPAGSSSLAGEGLSLAPRCVVHAPRGVTSIKVYDGVRPKSAGPHFTLDGDVSFKPGNNFAFAQVEGVNGFELRAVPGAGMGVIPCECEEGDDNSKSQLYSEDGHARLFNDTCYDMVPSTTDGTIQIHAKCTACCTCQMYEDIVNQRLVSIFNEVKQVKKDLKEYLATYEEAVDKFNKRMKRPAEEDVILTLSCAPQAKNLGSRLSPDGGVLGYMNRAIYTAVIRNNSFFDIDFIVENIEASGEIYEAVASWTLPGKKNMSAVISEGGGPDLFRVAPGYSLVITYVGVIEDNVHEADTDHAYSGSVTIKAMYYDLIDGVYKELHTYTKGVQI